MSSAEVQAQMGRLAFVVFGPLVLVGVRDASSRGRAMRLLRPRPKPLAPRTHLRHCRWTANLEECFR